MIFFPWIKKIIIKKKKSEFLKYKNHISEIIYEMQETKSDLWDEKVTITFLMFYSVVETSF